MNMIVPGQTTSTSRGSLFRQPHVGAGLHKYWGLHVRDGEPIINFGTDQLQDLGREDCREVLNSILRAKQEITQRISMHPQSSYLWLPFILLP